jgi:hypothetical protein
LLAFNEQSVVSLLMRGGFVLPAMPMPLRTFQFATLNSAVDGCGAGETAAPIETVAIVVTMRTTTTRRR